MSALYFLVILAAGLTPAWQQIVLLNRLVPGGVNRAREVHWCASGKVLNVALALHHLGAEVKALTLLGGRNGESIRDEFGALKLSARFIPSRSPTRVCTTLLDSGGGATTEIVQNSWPVDPAELLEFRAAFLAEAQTASVIVLTGSLPAGVPPSFYRDLAGEVRAPLILDIRGLELVNALSLRPLVVKPNHEELAQTVSAVLNNEADIFRAMKLLNDRGAQWVVVTNGHDPVLVSGPEEQFRLQPPAASSLVNPIGCGDCLAAGLALALTENKPIKAALRFAIAAAVENVSQLLPGRIERPAVERTAAMIMPDRDVIPEG